MILVTIEERSHRDSTTLLMFCILSWSGHMGSEKVHIRVHISIAIVLCVTLSNKGPNLYNLDEKVGERVVDQRKGKVAHKFGEKALFLQVFKVT